MCHSKVLRSFKKWANFLTLLPSKNRILKFYFAYFSFQHGTSQRKNCAARASGLGTSGQRGRKCLWCGSYFCQLQRHIRSCDRFVRKVSRLHCLLLISLIRPGKVTLSFTVHRPHYIFVPHERVIIFIFCHFCHYFMLTWRKYIYLTHNERRHAFNLSSSRLIERWSIRGGGVPTPFWISFRGEAWGIREGRGRYASERGWHILTGQWSSPTTQNNIPSDLIGRHVTWSSSRTCG